MELSKTEAKAVDSCEWLTKCFAEYMAPGQMVYCRKDLVGVKWRRDGFYAVLLFSVRGELWLADVAGSDHGNYQVCNDGENVTKAEWKSLKVNPYCDSFTIPD